MATFGLAIGKKHHTIVTSEWTLGIMGMFLFGPAYSHTCANLQEGLTPRRLQYNLTTATEISQEVCNILFQSTESNHNVNQV